MGGGREGELTKIINDNGVEHQPKYQAVAAQRMIPSLIRRLILDRVPPSRLVSYSFYLYVVDRA